jgi:hypothetical protein
VVSGPGECVGGGMAGEDGHAGDDGAGSAGAAVAGDFDAVAGAGEQLGVFDEVGGQLVVAWGAEVGPVDPVRCPVGLPGFAAPQQVALLLVG